MHPSQRCHHLIALVGGSGDGYVTALFRIFGRYAQRTVFCLVGTVTAYLGVLLPPPPEEEPELEGLVTVTAQVAVFRLLSR